VNLLFLNEAKQFEACQRNGFIDLQWNEGLDEVSGSYRHCANAIGSKVIVTAGVDHVVLNPESGRKKYVVALSFSHESEIGNIIYSQSPRTEMDLESALTYAQWQATLIFRLIEGSDATPLPRLPVDR